MAASSSSKGNNNNNFLFRCFHCKSETPTFRNGWQLRSGSLALLCDPCGSAYENGTFCLTFHRETKGWRDCKVCQKMLHCGCIMSRKDIVIMDYGGVCCLDCGNKPLIPANIAHMPVNDGSQLWKNLRAQSVDHCFKDELYVGSEKTMTAMSSELSPGTDVQLVTPRSRCKEKVPVIGDDSSSETNKSSESSADGARSRGVLSGSVHLQNLPKMNEKKHLKVLGHSNSIKTPLFQKVLTFSDARARSGRLVLPKKHAEAFLPKLDNPKGITLEVYDTDGAIWNFTYRFWINCKARMYVLEGLKDYSTIWDWQTGDRVKFYRIQPGGKLLIKTKKKPDDTQESKDLPPMSG